MSQYQYLVLDDSYDNTRDVRNNARVIRKYKKKQRKDTNLHPKTTVQSYDTFRVRNTGVFSRQEPNTVNAVETRFLRNDDAMLQ